MKAAVFVLTVMLAFIVCALKAASQTESTRQTKTPARVDEAKPGSPHAKDAQVRAACARLERHYAGVLPWLAQLYDPPSGGFFESVAARDDPRFGPDIQSLSIALNLLRESDLLRTMPDDIRAGFVRYLHSRQDPQTGFFFDPDYPQFRDEVRTRTRMLGMATSALQTLGVEPPHPLPGQQAGANKFADYVRSEEAWRAWLETNIGPKPGYSVDPGTGSMDLFNTQNALLLSLPDERRKKLARLAYDYLARTQDAQTGMWAGSVHALFKFASFVERQGLRFPRADAAYASTLAWFREHEPDKDPKNGLGAADTPRLGNPIRVVALLQPDLSQPIRKEDLLMMLDWYDKALPRFRQADGAFARWAEKFSIRPLDRQLAAAPAPQSDINGSSNAHSARLAAYRIAGVKPPPLAGASEFYTALRKRIAEHRASPGTDRRRRP